MDRQTRQRVTLTRIETAAWNLFHERGYDATSTRQIAEEARIGVGTLFNYFPEKRVLLLRLMQTQVDQATETASMSMPREGLRNQLAHLFGHIYTACAKERKLSRVFARELLFLEGPDRSDAAQWTYALVERIGRLVESAIERGEIKGDHDPLQVAQHIFSIYYFGLVTWLGGTLPSEKARDAYVDGAVELVFESLSA